MERDFAAEQGKINRLHPPQLSTIRDRSIIPILKILNRDLPPKGTGLNVFGEHEALRQ
jgi:hypothetical protein